MAKAYVHIFDDRGVIRLAGEDRATFLQGLVSNDVLKITPEHAGYGAFLTPQGKFLHDFFLAATGDALLIETAADRIDDFFRKLRMYRLRSKVELAVETDAWTVAAVFGADAFDALGLPAERGAAVAFAGGIAFTDPRHLDAGARVVVPAAGGVAGGADAIAGLGLTSVDRDAYDRRRVSLGLPDGARDMAVEKTVLLEAGFEELGGVDFQKGCYMGQELTARTKYRGLVKRRLMPIAIDGPLPAPGTEITLNGKEAGEVRSVVPNGVEGGTGLAMIRLNRLDEAFRSGAPLTAGEATVIPHKPDWARF